MMYKTPSKLVAIIRTGYEQPTDTNILVREVVNYGYIAQGVGSLLVTRWGRDVYITTYYWMTDKREAEFDAARNGFPFIVNENDLTIKVGLLARLYRAILA